MRFYSLFTALECAFKDGEYTFKGGEYINKGFVYRIYRDAFYFTSP